MQWQIREIWVLNPIKFTSFTTNELEGRATLSYARQRIAGQAVPYTAQFERQQRHNLVLKDVAYVIKADVLTEEEPGQHRDQFRRRVSTGACHTRPYFGIREYVAHFGDPAGDECPIPVSRDLGRMLFDLDYQGEGRGKPLFFNARLERGILYVPQHLYQEVRHAS